jgi:hypothetical protein
MPEKLQSYFHRIFFQGLNGIFKNKLFLIADAMMEKNNITKNKTA